MITIGVDSSTTNCGVAVFDNGNFKLCQNFVFGSSYNEIKLYDIVVKFAQYFEMYKPDLVVIEEPVPVKNSRAVTSLNQVAGAIFAVAVISGSHVNFIHNQVVKKNVGISDKMEINKMMKKTYKIKREITEHESDAIAVVHAYMREISD